VMKWSHDSLKYEFEVIKIVGIDVTLNILHGW
jgi:hypothetical protein